MTNISTQSFFNNAISALKAHNNYIGYVNFKAGLSTEKVSGDVYKTVHGTSPVFQFTLATAGEILALELDPDLTLDVLQGLGQKQVIRLIQCVNALNQGLVTKLDKTHARIFLALYAAGKGVRTSQLHRVAANTRIGSDNDQTLRERVNALFKGNHSIETVLSKQSNLTGKNGYAQILGLTCSEGFGHDRVVHLNESAPMIAKLLQQIARASDGQLRELMSGAE